MSLTTDIQQKASGAEAVRKAAFEASVLLGYFQQEWLDPNTFASGDLDEPVKEKFRIVADELARRFTERVNFVINGFAMDPNRFHAIARQAGVKTIGDAVVHIFLNADSLQEYRGLLTWARQKILKIPPEDATPQDHSFAEILAARYLNYKQILNRYLETSVKAYMENPDAIQAVEKAREAIRPLQPEAAHVKWRPLEARS